MSTALPMQEQLAILFQTMRVNCHLALEIDSGIAKSFDVSPHRPAEPIIDLYYDEDELMNLPSEPRSLPALLSDSPGKPRVLIERPYRYAL